MNTYKRHRFPPDIISYAVWLYHRFNLSNRDVEDLLAERGISVSYETIRPWCIKFGTRYARRLKQRYRGYGDTFYIDEVFVKINGRQRYQALQFHFHSPSEHHVKGESFPMEVHIVHANEAGDLAVIGIMFEIGDRNPLLDQLDSFRPPDLPPNTEPIDYNAIISSRTEYFNYSGSLTTPPCSEGVIWIVLKEPITASEDQIGRFFDTFGFSTNRPIQPHNARTVLE